MGVFSWLCAGCGQPILNQMITDKVYAELAEAVCVTGTGTNPKGLYDGYGRIITPRVVFSVIEHMHVVGEQKLVMMHRCCYQAHKARKTVYSGFDPGQGHFHGEREIGQFHREMMAYCQKKKPTAVKKKTVTVYLCDGRIVVGRCPHGVNVIIKKLPA